MAPSIVRYAIYSFSCKVVGSVLFCLPECSNPTVQTAVSLEWKVGFQQFRYQFIAYKIFF